MGWQSDPYFRYTERFIDPSGAPTSRVRDAQGVEKVDDVGMLTQRPQITPPTTPTVPGHSAPSATPLHVFAAVARISLRIGRLFLRVFMASVRAVFAFIRLLD